ncbi:MAG: flagellar basal-body MS-ring/collar protein FliF [Pseudomonadota bacterium]
MNSLLEFVKAIGVTRLAAMGAVAAGLFAFFIFLMFRFSTPQMTVLFSDLPFEDSISIVNKLEGMNVPHEIRQEGAIILVPQERVLKLRMQMAEDGLPVGSGVGYEIFDKSDNLGATSFVQDINHKRALEGELARTIRSIDRVQMARVMLVLPKKELFARDKADPSASIVVKVRGSLGAGQIKAIQHLVASAIEGMKPTRVSIVDENGRLHATGRGDENGVIAASTMEERNRSFEQRMQREVEEIVASVVGAGKVRVRVNAELDYNRVTQTSETYDPDGQVVRSTKTFSQDASSSQPTGNDAVTVGNELPAADANNADQQNASQKENQKKTEEVVNYEISKTHKTEVIEAGRIKRISVAVLVDGNYQNAADGTPAYQARPQQEIDEITNLVRTAIGFDNTRGDKVQVSNLRFAPIETISADENADAAFLNLSKNDYFYIAELVVTFLVAALLLLMVIRPLVNRIITQEDTIQLLDDGTENLGPDGQPLLEAPDGYRTEDGKVIKIEPDTAAVELLQNAKLSGEIQASFIREIGELVQHNPTEAVNVIRNWIHLESIENEAA